MIKFLLRPGLEPDRPAIQALLAKHGMEADLPPGEFLVAEVGGQLAGAARLEWEQQAAYLRPIVVDPAWQGKAIGRSLVRAIARSLPALHVVARGGAAGFYHKLGFSSLPWDQVPERYREECAACPDLRTCRPLPMALDRTRAGSQNGQDPPPDS